MKSKIAGLLALAAAALASICCIGPLLAAALGLGGLGLAALTPYRPLFLALTAAVLAFGFYRAYRKRPVECEDGRCEMRSGSRAAKAGLWILTAAALALAAFPRWSARLLGRSRPRGESAAAVPAGAQAIGLKISGMDCAACTVAIKKNLEKLPGVYSADVDFERGEAAVETDGKVDPQEMIQAVAAAGYQASVIGGGDHGKPRP